MSQEERDRKAFARLLVAIGPWLAQVVIVGGWAHRLFRVHPLAQELPYPPLMTRDADVAMPDSRPLIDEGIQQRLAAHGFKEEFFGTDTPPVTHYQLGSDGSFYAEFLTPLFGSKIKRTGPDTTTRIGGVIAQKLRHLEVLMIKPWSVTLGTDNQFPLPSAVEVQIPNPASYLAQKILIHTKRKPSERPKDVLYIHDTIEVFARSLAELRQYWVNDISPVLARKSRSQVERAPDAMFGSVTDVIREAAIASGRNLAPETLRLVCRSGLQEIFA